MNFNLLAGLCEWISLNFDQVDNGKFQTDTGEFRVVN